MSAHNHSSKRAISRAEATVGVGHEAEMVNRWLLGVIAEARRRYPSRVELPYQDIGVARELAGTVVGRLARDGLVELNGSTLALSEAGYAAVNRAGRSDRRFADLLHAGTMPISAAATSLVLAGLRAHFELYRHADWW